MGRKRILIAWLIVLSLCSIVLCEAEMLLPGKYCGVVIFDRWDGCTLLNGPYLTYVSEKVKEGLRRHSGQCILIDAKEVSQPVNPGDGVIMKFGSIGKSPEDRYGPKTDGIRLRSSAKVGENGKAIATIILNNTGKDAVNLSSYKLALTLLMHRNQTKQNMCASDGPSFALITRANFSIGDSEPRWEGIGVCSGVPYAWTIGKENVLPPTFTLMPKETKQIDITFDIPDGEYDFLAGYGIGGNESKCLASNLSAFDMKDGKARLVEIKGR